MDTTQHVGVLVARFQGQRLHPGWRSIIDTVRAKHPYRMLIALGVHGGERTKDDPLTYDERAAMVHESYADANITLAPIMDNFISSVYWSSDLDSLIVKHCPDERAILYGSRDSFIPHYYGKFPVESITPTAKYSGTELRAQALVSTSEEARAAIICAEQMRYPRVISTVDLAIIDRKRMRLPLISKDSFGPYWAFPGGYCEPDSISDKDDAVREGHQEVVGADFDEPQSITRDRVPVADPRYRKSEDKMRTNLFIANYLGGEPTAGDDAKRIRWFGRDEFQEHLVPWHRPLGEILATHWHA